MNDEHKWFLLLAGATLLVVGAVEYSEARRVDTVGKIIESCYLSGTKNCHEVWHKELG